MSLQSRAAAVHRPKLPPELRLSSDGGILGVCSGPVASTLPIPTRQTTPCTHRIRHDAPSLLAPRTRRGRLRAGHGDDGCAGADQARVGSVRPDRELPGEPAGGGGGAQGHPAGGQSEAGRPVSTRDRRRRARRPDPRGNGAAAGGLACRAAGAAAPGEAARGGGEDRGRDRRLAQPRDAQRRRSRASGSGGTSRLRRGAAAGRPARGRAGPGGQSAVRARPGTG